MSEKLFTNQIVVNATLKQVHEALVDPQNLLKWVPEVTKVNSSQNLFNITRTEKALNQQELIEIFEDKKGITYQSTNGKVEYNVNFSLFSDGAKTTIKEVVSITRLRTLIPVKLLTPIAKHAFQINLNHLKDFIESV